MKRTGIARKVLLLLLAGSAAASASVSLLVQEAVGGSGEFTGSGHIALYFSDLCADTPLNLRLCGPGEPGAVISAYPNWGTQTPYVWMAIPLPVFLYGVDESGNVLLYGNGKIRRLLREDYRRRHLGTLLPYDPEAERPEGRWSEIVGSSLNRDIYALTVKTTQAQDLAFLEAFLARPNTHAFNTVSNNCADFVRKTINLIFPSAAYRDILNDFGMTTPKALARSFTEYATSRPELDFRVEKFSQTDGTIRRSMNNRNFTEKALVSKKYFLTIITTKPEVYGAFTLLYFLTGWYSLDGQYHKRPSSELADQLRAAPSSPDTVLLTSVDPLRSPVRVASRPPGRKTEATRRTLFGGPKVWEEYRAKFAPLLAEAFRSRLFLDSEELRTFYKDLELQSEPELDGAGGVILRVDDRGTLYTLGVTHTNIRAPVSDPVLGYKLMLAKVDYMLSAPRRNQLSLPDFEDAWLLLRMMEARARTAPPRPSSGEQRFRQREEVLSGSGKAQKFLMVITH